VEAIKDENNILAIIPEKEIFNRTTLDKKSVSAFESDHKIYTKHKKFFDEISDSFNKISTTI